MFRLLVTTDGSNESKAVFPIAVRLAREAGASLTLLTVIDPAATPMAQSETPVVTPGGAGSGSIWGPTMQVEGILHPAERRWAESRDQAIQRAGIDALEMLKDIASGLEGVRAESRVLMSDKAAHAIIGFARDEKVDLIAMSTHGRSGVREALQGSVAGEVMRSGVAPVLMVRPV